MSCSSTLRQRRETRARWPRPQLQQVRAHRSEEGAARALQDCASLAEKQAKEGGLFPTGFRVAAGRPSCGGRLTKVCTPACLAGLLHPRGSTSGSTKKQVKLKLGRARTNRSRPNRSRPNLSLFRSGVSIWPWHIFAFQLQPLTRQHAKRCLTLPSSGPPPAWPASLLLFMFRCTGQAGGGPLMSNVRQRHAP